MASAATSRSGGWSAFAKTVLVPLAVALLLYVTIFFAILPLYRRYRSNIARYASYVPLDSSLARRTTSLLDPIIEPSKGLWARATEKIRTMLWRWAFPGLRAADLDASGARRAHDIDDEEEMEGDLFHGDDQGGHGEGFDDQQSTRRLSRDLEEGFRDDSGSEDEWTEGVTLGRSQSRSRNRS